MYPQLVIDTMKLKENVQFLTSLCHEKNLSVMGVTKIFLADEVLAQCYMDGGVDYLADSRIINLKRLSQINLPKVLLRLPSISEVETVVRYAHISLNSELRTIEALDDAARMMKMRHKIILMVDLGDLREGILPEDFDVTVTAIKEFKHIDLVGIGVNLTCYGAIIPNADNLGQLVTLAERLEQEHGIKAEIVSGGNSSSLYLLGQDGLPEGINNLRLGESLVLGRETAYGADIEECHQDVFTLRAEVIEYKRKPSLPTGEVGVDAFGNKPVYEDKGEMLRAIVSIGKQDVFIDNLIPRDERIEIVGASSDHLILDLTKTGDDYAMGSIIEFDVEYGALLSLLTSEYVSRVYR